MDSTAILSTLEQLDDEIDDLEDSLAPVLKTPLTDTASKLPLLDKAKIYVLTTYAIESILFSYLRLHGVKARDHPVFTELTRVRQYFNKITSAETPVTERENLSLDKKAAGRFIKAGLSGNDRYDLERAEKVAKERARAHIRFENVSKTLVPTATVINATRIDDNVMSDDAETESKSSSDINDPSPTTSKKRKPKMKNPIKDRHDINDNGKGKKRAKKGNFGDNGS